ncbi:MAG: polyprenyl synthetase family protein [Alphaproteobacteria bacterium]|nr:polyprenyl synthetase family protein [Alphaproteobacteria bacterium]
MPAELDIADFAARFLPQLEACLLTQKLSEPYAAPEALAAAMRHGALNGGKRLRPLLVVETAGVFDMPEADAMPAAVAVELVHCFSLVHDDLPAMDDDDLRRGKPTVHKAFDEATAILAGDALHSRAFAILAGDRAHPDPSVRMALVTELAMAAGAGGMAGGQQRDLEGERGGFSNADIAQMQMMKTGALIRAAVRMGALIGGAAPDAMAALTLYGEAAGRAFQLADDILDLTATPEQMGKATHKDDARNKPTLLARIGLDAAQRHLGDHIHRAISALSVFGHEADGLRAIARYFAVRDK